MIESSGKKEGWSECFQDLGNWCPLPPDELHTPKVNLQDEFNFSNDDGHANEWDLLSSPVDLNCDPLGDVTFGISPFHTGIGEINNTFVQEGTPLGVIHHKNTNLIGSGGKLVYTLTSDSSNKSPLKSKGNVLLSQGIVKSEIEDRNLLNMTATLEHRTNSPVVIANNCLLLPVTVPEFASAKLNSSSLSTLVTPSLQSPSPTPPPSPVNKVSVARKITPGGTLSQSNSEKASGKNKDQGLEENFIKVPVVDKVKTNDMIPVYRREKPHLKLNIAAANNASKLNSTLNTPEVLKSLEDGDTKGFSLLQYLCNDGDFPGLSQGVEEEDDRNLDQTKRDHDYADPWASADIKSDLVIKSEPGSPASTSYSVSERNVNKSGTSRKRHRDDSSDYIASDDSDENISEDDSQQEWSPVAKKRTKRKSSTNSSKSNKNGGKKSAGRRGNQAGKETGGQDKYRALRERNNEASRRSRMNRKQRDTEMLNIKDDLEKRNVYLKARAEKMENLVKYMRAEIMKALTKPRQPCTSQQL